MRMKYEAYDSTDFKGRNPDWLLVFLFGAVCCYVVLPVTGCADWLTDLLAIPARASKAK